MDQQARETAFEYLVTDADTGRRLDVVLLELLEGEELNQRFGVPTRSKIARWIADGRIRIGGREASKAGIKLRSGDLLEVRVPELAPVALEPDPSVRFEVVFEDEDLLVIDKPAGLVVHPGAGVHSSTLVHGLLAYLTPERPAGEPFRPGIVHRLDKDTSGLMVVAKNDFSYQSLVQQFIPPRRIARRYLALVSKPPAGENHGVVAAAIARHPKERTRFRVSPEGRSAVTEWKLVERFTYGALLQLTLTTGRTHQIRVHLQHLNAAILGDPIYGAAIPNFPSAIRAAAKKLDRQALHAYQLEFQHPRSAELLAFERGLPQDICDLREVLRRFTAAY